MNEQVVHSFGARLRKLRAHCGMTQMEFATAHNLDRSFISDMERGHKVASLITLARLAVAFGMTLSALLDGVHVVEPEPAYAHPHLKALAGHRD